MSDTFVAFVTGASKGVGRGIAIGLAKAGWDVAINYCNDQAGAEQTAAVVSKAGRNAWLVKGDVGYSEQVTAMFAQLAPQAGRLRLVVNNAGVQTWASLLELQEEDWDRVIRTNLKGTFLCTQAAARIMIQHDGGSIINIGSGANKRPFPNLVDYGASKGGIERLTQVAAVELGPKGIRVNCVAPGAIEIERTQDESEDYAGTWAPITPARRIGVPADVAEAVVFLASEHASFITGQTVYVDGGLFTQAPWPYPPKDS
ncbi:MAG: SDR family NAD(P)-dependent oxidoreductase [Pirellulaceae bacterium]|nr:SDR family NAD(P)-dependent oxidoreductase [Pirellulaceae bacterium]